MKKRNCGFTLAELSIVVIIIGFILALVSRFGPSLIESAKGKALLKQTNDIRVANRQFVERFKMLPGDFPAKATDFPDGTSATCLSGGVGVGAGAGLGNGLISTAESACVGEHLFRAGLIPSALLSSEHGTMVVISNADAQTLYTDVFTIAPALTLPAQIRNIILIQNIPCNQALTIDQGLDDGNLSTGNSVINMSPACSGTSLIWLAVALQ